MGSPSDWTADGYLSPATATDRSGDGGSPVSTELEAPRSRRALLVAGLGAMGAGLASAIARPSRVRAADGENLILGALNAASSQTSLDSNAAIAFNVFTTSGTAVRGETSGLDTSGVTGLNSNGNGVLGDASAGSGVAGVSVSGTGVRATSNMGAGLTAASNSGSGVDATSTSGPGISASTGSGTRAAIEARSPTNKTALLAISGGDVVAVAAKIGVYGYANQDASARAIYGKSLLGSGVWGNSDTGRGVFGRSTSGTGVSAQSDTGRAVYATTAAADKAALVGQNTQGITGIQGVAGAALAPAPTPETGVEGVASLTGHSNGVVGKTALGTGVKGISGDPSGVATDTSRTGVYGYCPVSTSDSVAVGVWGDANDGFGVYGGSGSVGVYGFGFGVGVVAASDSAGIGLYGFAGDGSGPVPVDGTGVLAGAEGIAPALDVRGVAKFSRSGITSLASGSTKVVGGVALTPSSMVLAVLQTNRAGVWVRAVVPNVAASSFTIYLNTSVSATTNVAWFVVG